MAVTRLLRPRCQYKTNSMNLVETNVVHVMVQVRVQYAMATAKLIQKESIIMI